MSSDGRFAFVAAGWQRRDGSCHDRYAGALHVVDLSSGIVTTLEGLGALPGAVARSSSTFVAIPYELYDFSHGPEFYRVSIGPVPTLERIPLPAPARSVASAADRFFFLLSSDQVLVWDSSGSAVSISTVADPNAIETIHGDVFVSGSSQISEIDPYSLTEVRRFFTCVNGNGLAALGPTHSMKACSSGLAIIDTAGNSQIFDTADSFGSLTGSDSSERGLAETGGFTRIVVVDTGEAASAISGSLDGRAAFLPGNIAYASIGRHAYRVDLATGTTTPPAGAEALFPDYSRVAPASSSTVVWATGNNEDYSGKLFPIATGTNTLEPPIMLSPPATLPGSH